LTIEAVRILVRVGLRSGDHFELEAVTRMRKKISRQYAYMYQQEERLVGLVYIKVRRK
jgi:hypothetical protein